MAADNKSWHSLPIEIRIMILEVLLQDGCSLASSAAVSREWQRTIEPHNFARICLTPPRLTDFGPMIHRNRAFVRYIWLCLELDEYDCTQCEPPGWDRGRWGLSGRENLAIANALRRLFSTLSAWELHGNLVLDISVHSPSDSKHRFKHLTFEPDVPLDERECIRGAQKHPVVDLVEVDDYRHGWVAGRQDSAPPGLAIDKTFGDIMGEGPFDTDEQENRWWRQLPLVPAVTGVLLRQQNRRRWYQTALIQMFARLPSLQEIHYEPWREWDDIQQIWTDLAFRWLLESLASRSSQLRRLILFENFNHGYPRNFPACELVRIPAPHVSQAAANASLELEHLSASFMVDASYFFNGRKPSWKWPNLASLALTSRLLAPYESQTDIDDMLRAAAAAAMSMPSLRTMEIWNGQEGLAMVFRYQPAGGGRSALITWRGTWKLALRRPVMEAWEAVALRHRSQGLIIVNELLGEGTVVRSHGDAIHYLRLSNSVIRPVSLRQIRMEHRMIRGVRN